MNKYNCNSSTGCFLKVDLKYPKELRELYYYYRLASDEIEIKKEMLCKYQLMIFDLCMCFLLGLSKVLM